MRPGANIAIALAGVLHCAAMAAAQDVATAGPRVSVNFSHALPNVPGKKLEAVVVDYAPGGTSASHRHAKSAFIYAYVVSGSVRSQVDDAPPRVYTAGQSFYELPGQIHRVSENASKTEPARLLAVFVVDDGEKLTVPATR